MSDELNPYRMTAAEMAQIRALIPHLRWRRSSVKEGGGCQAQGANKGMRLWVTANPPYREPRTGYLLHVMESDWSFVQEIETPTIAEAVTALDAWLREELGRQAVLLAGLLPAGGIHG